MMTQSWQLWAVLSAGFAALTAVLAKAGVRDIAPDVATMVRTAVVLVVASGIVVLTNQVGAVMQLDRRSIGWLVLSGSATGASWLCYFRALKLGPTASVASVDKLSVVIVASLAWGIWGEKLDATALAGIALIAAGGFLVAR